MKFLLDVGISPRLGELLTEQGHGYRFVPNFYSPKTEDSDILKIALDEIPYLKTSLLLLKFTKILRGCFRDLESTPSVFWS